MDQRIGKLVVYCNPPYHRLITAQIWEQLTQSASAECDPQTMHFIFQGIKRGPIDLIEE